MRKPLARIVAAVPEELDHLCRCHGLSKQRQVRAGLAVWRGEVGGCPVEAVATGIGAERARAGVVDRLSTGTTLVLVFVGTAGALSPQLSVGDLLVAERLVAAEDPSDVVPVPASTWSARASALERGRAGTLVSESRIVATAAEKTELARRLGLAPDLLAVDMESHAWASAARDVDRPFVVLRAISDAAEEDLPVDLGGAVRPDGSVSRVRVLAGALRRPSSVQSLLELRDRVKLCSRVLEQAVVSLLA